MGRTSHPSLFSFLSLVSLPSLVSFLLLIYFSLFLIKKKNMTISLKILSTYSPCLRKQKIKVADGSFSHLEGKGTVQISPILSLKSVLHVPNLSYNLLSIGKLIKDINHSG